MEKQGVVTLSIIPVRELPSHKSQMVSQFLFGETVEVLEETEEWLFVKNSTDGYVGWVEQKQLTPISITDLHKWNSLPKFVVTTPSLNIEFENQKMTLSAGAILSQTPDFLIGNLHFKHSITETVKQTLAESAMQFIHAPYLWGGKSIFGFDCSGFTQTVFKTIGIELFRDASKQVEQGVVVNFLEEVLPGDLAFFHNQEDKIVHVGVMLSSSQIIHCSGVVRIDNIDHQGIYNTQKGEYTHALRVIKRVKS